MAEQLICPGCGKRVTNRGGTVIFKCPDCGEYDIVRCKQCRQNARPYKCPKCGFEGPN